MTTTETSLIAPLDVAAVRQAFPALSRAMNGVPVIYADNPAGTQVPQACMDAIVAYMTEANANSHGAFQTSQRSDARSTSGDHYGDFLRLDEPSRSLDADDVAAALRSGNRRRRSRFARRH